MVHPTIPGSELLKSAEALKEILDYVEQQAETGPAALTVLDEQPNIDLVFTDLVMPGGMTGVDLACKVQRRRPGTKVLYASGYADRAMDRNGVVPAGDEFLGKPYQQQDLARKVRQVLDR